MRHPTVSIVIPAYECAATIERVIQCLLQQTYTPHEIIIVDDGSTDQTAQIIQSFPEVIYLSQKNAGPAVARNRGAFQATGDMI